MERTLENSATGQTSNKRIYPFQDFGVKQCQGLKQAAIRYARQGIPVFPCRRSKRPITPNGFHDATTDVSQIEKWWDENPKASIGMPTGEISRFWVLDTDVYKPEGEEAFRKLMQGHSPLPDTLTQETGGGGRQYFFRHPGFKIVSRNGYLEGPGLDIKGDGGYVIVPPSGHPSGGHYRWLDERPAADAPEWLLELVKEKPRQEYPTIRSQELSEIDTPYGLKALEREAAKVGQAAKGTRNETLNKAAFAIGGLVAGGELSQARAEKVLLNAAKAAGLPEREARRTLISGMESGGKTPRQAPNNTQLQSQEAAEVPDNSIEWEKPVLINDPILPEMVPLPGILGKISHAIATATETPVELATGMVLATFATACQGRFIVRVRSGYSEPLNIWIIVALDSGNRKSSVLIEATRPLISWESQKRFEMEEDIKLAESKKKTQEARLKSLRGKYGKAKSSNLDKIEDEIQELESRLVEVPVAPRTWTDDITTERLGTLMSQHDERMAVLSAEGGIIDTIAGRYSNGVPNMDLYLKGHSGDPVRVDRGSRDPVYLKRPALTMGLSPQPEVLRNMAGLPGFRGRGFIARAGYLLPKSPLGYRSLETEPAPRHVLDAYVLAIHSLLNIEPTTGEHGESVPHVLELTKEAYQEWMDFARVVETNLREGGRFEFMKDWAGKLPGFAIRLAGVLHCAEDHYQPWAHRISLDTMKKALELASIFSSHSKAVFDLMGANGDIETARKIWRWVEQRRLSQFTKRDCYNSLKGSFPRVRDMEPGLDVLEERHYISAARKQTGGRPSFLYNVNPKVMEEW